MMATVFSHLIIGKISANNGIQGFEHSCLTSTTLGILKIWWIHRSAMELMKWGYTLVCTVAKMRLSFYQFWNRRWYGKRFRVLLLSNRVLQGVLWVLSRLHLGLHLCAHEECSIKVRTSAWSLLAVLALHAEHENALIIRGSFLLVCDPLRSHFALPV